MTPELSDLLYGGIGGGIAAGLLHLIEKWMGAHLEESLDARKKLRLYAKPLWLECDQLEFRLRHIERKLPNPDALRVSPANATALDWYTKDGYYASSTAYLIASVAAWIRLFQRDVVFLEFGQQSLTAAFFNRVEAFKTAISSGESILWYHYVQGIGEQLTPEGQPRPMSYAAFCHRMFTDALFRSYYDELFQFLGRIAGGEFQHQIGAVLDALREIKVFLEANAAVPLLTQHRSEHAAPQPVSESHHSDE